MEWWSGVEEWWSGVEEWCRGVVEWRSGGVVNDGWLGGRWW